MHVSVKIDVTNDSRQVSVTFLPEGPSPGTSAVMRRVDPISRDAIVTFVYEQCAAYFRNKTHEELRLG